MSMVVMFAYKTAARPFEYLFLHQHQSIKSLIHIRLLTLALSNPTNQTPTFNMQFFAILLAAAGLAAAAQVERVRRDDTYTQDVDFNNFCHLGENPKCCKSVVGQIVQSECDNGECPRAKTRLQSI